MMISIGYYFDQVSRERMVQRISEQVNLIGASRPADVPVGTGDVLWIETAHPHFHELDITWLVDGQAIDSARNLPYLETRALKLPPGAHRISVTVVDPTPFVRDPEIRGKVLTATRSRTMVNTIGTAKPTETTFTGSTPTTHPVAGTAVLYVNTANPPQRVLQVSWQVDGKPVAPPGAGRTFLSPR